MPHKRIYSRAYFPYLLVSTAALVLIALLIAQSIRQLHMNLIARDLEDQARLIGSLVGERMSAGDPEAIGPLIDDLGQATATRITVILPSGEVVGETGTHAGRMDPLSAVLRPEVAAALEGRLGRTIRFSEAQRRQMLYVAVPVGIPESGRERIVAVVRAAVPTARFGADLRAIHVEIALIFAGLAALFAWVGWRVARRIRRPIEQVRREAEAFVRGDFSRPLTVTPVSEVGGLVQTLNLMAAQLDERIRLITEQRNELSAILAGMVEGVLAVDGEGRVVSANPAAAKMLHIDSERTRGKPIQEVVRNPALQELVARALESAEPVEGEVEFHNEGSIHLKIHGTSFRDPEGVRSGAVLVLNDVTRLRGLERMRQDFVANVTHELRTPITSIQAAAETLMEGTVRHEEDAERFLAIIARQGRRLNTIIEDLLQLARIESDAGLSRTPLQDHSLELVLAGAVQACGARAADKSISLEMSCDPTLTAMVNPALLENAIVNLIDNAIKYSEPRTPVRISAYEVGEEIIIEVIDRGLGIERRHHERIFERFYVVDKARSRSAGGTGLGLAIVKHIAQSHGGRVEVESAPGAGSTFRLILPRRPSRESHATLTQP
ncbi:MAG: ATP-binding protein [Candidatus Eisenbacteria bacterium]